MTAMGDQFYKKEDIRKINVLAQIVPDTMQALVEIDRIEPQRHKDTNGAQEFNSNSDFVISL